MEASTLTHAQRRGLFARRSPLLRFQEDAALVSLTRRGHQHAFEALVERYQSRLLGFCRQMLGSTEDAEDVLQEVFVAAYNAMIADEREIAVRPWLYRIARNRCLNHLRKPTADGQDTMDTMPHMNGVTTLERVQNREEFRNLLDDVSHLPETQRSALLLREIDAMSYEEIAQAMDTTVPGREVAARPRPHRAGRVEPGARPHLRRRPGAAGRGRRGAGQDRRAGTPPHQGLRGLC